MRSSPSEAGRRLGAAGMRALRRGDMHAAANLLERATSLLASRRILFSGELLCELGLVRVAVDESTAAAEVLTEAIAAGDGDRRASSRGPRANRARVHPAEARAAANRGRSADRDGRGNPGLRACVRPAGARPRVAPGRLRARRPPRQPQDVAGGGRARARALQGRAGWPTPRVSERSQRRCTGARRRRRGRPRCESLLETRRSTCPAARTFESSSAAWCAGAATSTRGRELVELGPGDAGRARPAGRDRTYCLPVLGEIELLAGKPAAAAAILRELCDRLERAERLQPPGRAGRATSRRRSWNKAHRGGRRVDARRRDQRRRATISMRR